MNYLALAAGFLTGIISSWGIGGGTLLVIFMTAFSGIPQKTAQGINLLYFLPTSVSALYCHGKNNLIDKSVVFPAIVAGSITAFITSTAAVALDVSILRKFFGLFLILIGLSELMKKTAKPNSTAE